MAIDKDKGLYIRFAGITAVAISAIALLGFEFGIPRLTSLGAGLIPMAPSTALLFIFFGFAVNFAAREPLTRFVRMFCATVAVAGTLVALVLCIMASYGIRSDLEHMGFSTLNISLPGIHVGHMSIVTAIFFMFVGVSLLAFLISREGRYWYARVALIFAFFLMVICFILLLAYLLGTPMFYGGGFIPPAATTIFAFAALGIALYGLAYRHIWPQGGQEEPGKHGHTGFILFMTFCALVAGIVSVGYLYFRNYEKSYLTQVESQLLSIVDLKANDLAHWRKERTGDANIILKNAAFSSLIRDFLTKTGDPEFAKELSAWMNRYLLSYDYDQVRLLDTQGVTRICAPDDVEPASSNTVRVAAEALRTGQVTLLDFYRNEYDKHVYLSIIVPIFDCADSNRPLGVLVLRIDPEDYLCPNIQKWPINSNTAETLLFRRDGEDVIYLNDLRFHTNAMLSLRIPLTQIEVPAVKTALGQTGFMQGHDYRNHEVMAGTKHVPDSPWFLIAKVDKSELYGPLRQQLWMIVMTVGTLLLSTGAILMVIWRQERLRFYKEQYKIEEALRFVSVRHEAILEAVPDIIIEVDRNKVYVWSNQSGFEFFGDDVIGKEALFYFEGEQNVYQEVQPLFSGSENAVYLESWQRRKDGEARLLAWWCRVLKDSAGNVTGAISSARDITERKKAEEALHEITGRLKLATAAAKAGVWDWNLITNEMIWDDRMLELYGLTRKNFPGGIEAWKNGLHPDDAARAFEECQAALRGEQEFDTEFRVRHPDGTVLHIKANGLVLRDRTGKPRRMIGLNTDITDRKLAEEKLVETSIELRERNEELQHFTYAASHDLKSPLVTIRTFVGFLAQDIQKQDKEKMDKDFGYIRAAADKMSQLLDEVLKISRVGRKINPSIEVSLQDVVKEALELVAGRIVARGVKIVVTAEPVMLYGDRVRLVEVFQNLVDNAVKFMGDQKEPRIEIGVRGENSADRIQESEASKKQGGPAAPRAGSSSSDSDARATERAGILILTSSPVFFVRDNGIGVDPRHKDKLFGLFEKLHPESEGTGIGLALVKKIVESHGGKIWIESDGHGKGSCFMFTLGNGKK